MKRNTIFATFCSLKSDEGDDLIEIAEIVFTYVFFDPRPMRTYTSIRNISVAGLYVNQ